MKVLVVLSVEDAPRCVDLITDNFKKLEKYEDEFDFALLHFDGSNEHWKKQSWYNDSSRVVFVSMERGTKTFQWKKIKPDLAEQYDYIWLSDCDLGLEKFNWECYREILNKSHYLITQPSVLPLKPGAPWPKIRKWKPGTFYKVGGRSSDNPILRHRKGAGSCEIVWRSEVQTPIISTKCWPLIYEKLSKMNNKSIWGIDTFWDRLVKKQILLVHCSPVVHYDTRTLVENGAKRWLITIPKIKNENVRVKKFVEKNYKKFKKND